MASSDDAKLPCDKRTLQGDLLEVLRRSGFHDAAATLEDLRAQEHLERRKLGDGKKKTKISYFFGNTVLILL